LGKAFLPDIKLVERTERDALLPLNMVSFNSSKVATHGSSADVSNLKSYYL